MKLTYVLTIYISLFACRWFSLKSLHCGIVLRRIHLNKIKSTHPFVCYPFLIFRLFLFFLYSRSLSLMLAFSNSLALRLFLSVPLSSLYVTFSTHLYRPSLIIRIYPSFSFAETLSGQSRSIEPALICIATSRAGTINGRCNWCNIVLVSTYRPSL